MFISCNVGHLTIVIEAVNFNVEQCSSRSRAVHYEAVQYISTSGVGRKSQARSVSTTAPQRILATNTSFNLKAKNQQMHCLGLQILVYKQSTMGGARSLLPNKVGIKK